MKVILASASPRRSEILKQAGISFEVRISNVSEETEVKEPKEMVRLLSKRKALAAGAAVKEDCIIIAADTVVSCNGKILGKPAGHEDAVRMLTEISGGSHFVYTGVTLLVKNAGGMQIESFAEGTKVWIQDMTEEQIARYALTDEPMDKAGAYAVQGGFAVYVKGIEGDYYNVVGLPISAVYQRLLKMGYDLKK